MLLRGNIGRPGRGRVPGARALATCRATARWASTSSRRPRSSTRSARCSASTPPRTPGSTPSSAIAGDARRRGAGVRRARRQLRVGDARHRAHRGGARALRADGAASRPSSTARTCDAATAALILPCLGRTERDVQDGGEQFVTVEDSMSDGARLARRSRPPSRAAAQRGRDRRRPGRALLGDDGPVDWESLGRLRRIRDQIARVVPGLRPTSTSACAARTASSCRTGPRDRARSRPPTGGELHRQSELARLRVPPGRLLLMTIRARPVQHDDLRPRRSLPRHPRRAPRGVRATRTTWPSSASSTATSSTSSPSGTTASASPRPSASSPTTARGCCAAYFPEANVLVPLDSTADDLNTPTSKSIVVRLQPTRTSTTSGHHII